jgi:hypothetical protein
MGNIIKSGCLYIHNASQVITINAQNQYHGIPGFAENGCNIGTTIVSFLSGAITNTANNGGVLRCTDTSHGLTTGNYIFLNDMGDGAHVGCTRVTVVDTDTFDCDHITYNSSSDTGYWQRSSGIKIGIGGGGMFDVKYSFSFSGASGNVDFIVEIYVNETLEETVASARKIGIADDTGNQGSGNLVRLTSGDVVHMAIKNITTSANATLKYGGFSLSRK